MYLCVNFIYIYAVLILMIFFDPLNLDCSKKSVVLIKKKSFSFAGLLRRYHTVNTQFLIQKADFMYQQKKSLAKMRSLNKKGIQTIRRHPFFRYLKFSFCFII